MYLVEGTSHDHDELRSFSSIPVSMYWAVVTITTIGFGDIVPRTTGGQVLCSFVGLFAVCIGSIPIAIIGAGYVEELGILRKEDALAASRSAHLEAEVLMDSSDVFVRANSDVTEAKGEEASETLAGLKVFLARATGSGFIAGLSHEELSEIQQLLQKTSGELASFAMSELAVLRQQHRKAMNPMA